LAARCFQFQRMFDWQEGDDALAEGAQLARTAAQMSE
jgi:hypothetical protein